MASGRPPWRNWYKTARWAQLRLQTFIRDHYTCRICARVDPTPVCDHVKPHRGDGRLFWDPDNLQTLCKPCHDRVKQREEQATRHQRGVWD